MATASQAASIVSDVAAVSLSHVERLYVQRSLDLMIATNERSLKKELPGSPVIPMREKETLMLRDLRARFGANNG